MSAPSVEETTCRHGLTRSSRAEVHATDEEWRDCAGLTDAPHVYKANVRIDLKLNLGTVIAVIAVVGAIVWLVAR